MDYFEIKDILCSRHSCANCSFNIIAGCQHPKFDGTNYIGAFVKEDGCYRCGGENIVVKSEQELLSIIYNRSSSRDKPELALLGCAFNEVL